MPRNASRFEAAVAPPHPRSAGFARAEMLEAAHGTGLDVLYLIGGNHLETMPDRRHTREALEQVKLRVHQDIVLNTSRCSSRRSRARAAGADALRAALRRHQHIDGAAHPLHARDSGPRIAEARPEWKIPVDLALAVRPELKPAFPWRGPADIRAELGEGDSIYAGIETLEREGQWVQWGGERLFTDGFARMPNGRARFTVVSAPEVVIPEDHFHLTTRRGKQFNSITYGQSDLLMGSRDRRDVLMNPADAERPRCARRPRDPAALERRRVGRHRAALGDEGAPPPGALAGDERADPAALRSGLGRA